VRGGILALIALGTAQCRDAGLGTRVAYEVSEDPHPLIGGIAGSCMSKTFMLYPDLRCRSSLDPEAKAAAVDG
jgi:hypothetical protein